MEVRASELESLPFTEPVLPAVLDAGQVIDLPFTIPAPRLGPPTAHGGVAAIAWAVEAHWDVGFGADERVAAFVDVRQHPDLLRAGVLTLPSGALNDAVTDEGASIAVTPLPPVTPGADLQVAIAWPDAPGGRSARVELVLDVGGDSTTSQVISTVQVDGDAHGRHERRPAGARGSAAHARHAGHEGRLPHQGHRGPQDALGREPGTPDRPLLRRAGQTTRPAPGRVSGPRR